MARLPTSLDFAAKQARKDLEAANDELNRAIKANAPPDIIAALAAKVAKAANALARANKPKRKTRR
jgi:hypothetical protein